MISVADSLERINASPQDTREICSTEDKKKEENFQRLNGQEGSEIQKRKANLWRHVIRTVVAEMNPLIILRVDFKSWRSAYCRGCRVCFSTVRSAVCLVLHA